MRTGVRAAAMGLAGVVGVVGVVGVALTLAWVSPAYAQDVSGTWQFRVELDAGSGTPTFVFAQDADVVSGTYRGTFGRAEITGKIVGALIEFWFETQGTKATYTGTIDGDTMSGQCDYGEIGSGVWEGERVGEVSLVF